MNPENKNYGLERQKPGEYGEQARDYPLHLKKIHDEMERDLKFNPEAFGYGPVFHLKTSKGMQVQVKTFHFDKQNSSIGLFREITKSTGEAIWLPPMRRASFWATA